MMPMVVMVVTNQKLSDTSRRTLSQLEATTLTLLITVYATSQKLLCPQHTQSLVMPKSLHPLLNSHRLLQANLLLYPLMQQTGDSTLLEFSLTAAWIPMTMPFFSSVFKMELGILRILGVVTGEKLVTLDLKTVTHAVLLIFLSTLLFEMRFLESKKDLLIHSCQVFLSQ